MQLQNSIALNQIHLMYVSFRIGDNKINNILAGFFSNLSDIKHKLKGFYTEIDAHYVWDLISSSLCLSLSTCMAVIVCHTAT